MERLFLQRGWYRRGIGWVKEISDIKKYGGYFFMQFQDGVNKIFKQNFSLISDEFLKFQIVNLIIKIISNSHFTFYVYFFPSLS